MHHRVQQLSWLTGIEWLPQEDAICIYDRTDRLQSREHYGFAPELVRVVERVSSEIDMTEWLRFQVPEHTSHVLIVFAREQVCRLSTASHSRQVKARIPNSTGDWRRRLSRMTWSA